MTALGTGLDILKAQVLTPRPVQFETPDSYLARLCAANVIDVDYIRQLATYRRRMTGRREELGYVIAELGGPDPEHFRGEQSRALIHAVSPVSDAFAATSRTRPACTRCATGDDVRTYDHRRFMICLKHNRWIGNRITEQRQIEDYELRKVERRFRRLMATGPIPREAHDAVVAAIERHSPTLGERLWLGHRRHDHPDIDRFPARTRILATIAAYLKQKWPPELGIVVLHRRPEQSRLYDYLRAGLTWLGRPADNWKFIDTLVQIVLELLDSRADPFAGYELEPASGTAIDR